MPDYELLGSSGEDSEVELIECRHNNNRDGKHATHNITPPSLTADVTTTRARKHRASGLTVVDGHRSPAARGRSNLDLDIVDITSDVTGFTTRHSGAKTASTTNGVKITATTQVPKTQPPKQDMASASSLSSMAQGSSAASRKKAKSPFASLAQQTLVSRTPEYWP